MLSGAGLLTWKWSSATVPPTLRTFRELARFMLHPGRRTCKDKPSAHQSTRSREHSKATPPKPLSPWGPGTVPNGEEAFISPRLGYPPNSLHGHPRSTLLHPAQKSAVSLRLSQQKVYLRAPYRKPVSLQFHLLKPGSYRSRAALPMPPADFGVGARGAS